VPQIVGMNAPRLRRHCCPLPQASEKPPDGCLVEPASARRGEQRSVSSSLEVDVDRVCRPWRGEAPSPAFPPFRVIPGDAMTALGVEIGDICAESLPRYESPFIGEQQDEGIGPWTVR